MNYNQHVLVEITKFITRADHCHRGLSSSSECRLAKPNVLDTLFTINLKHYSCSCSFPNFHLISQTVL